MRKRRSDRNDNSPNFKKQKLTERVAQYGVGEQAAVENTSQIRSTQDLQRLLAFSQDTDCQQARQNIKNFKAFLDSIAYGENEDDRPAKLTILLHYLQLQKSPQFDNNLKCLADVVQTWSFANQSNDESLFSAIAAVLALFLKVTSDRVEFREHGNDLCNTLLRDDQINLFSRGLNTYRPKKHVVSPCLRLLTQIVTYDGGTAAKSLYVSGDVIFKRLENFLKMRDDLSQKSGSRPSPSIRDNALRFFFANLRLQDRFIKTAMLNQERMIRSVFQDIDADSPTIISEILNAFEQDVLKDQTISKAIKSKLFTDEILSYVATLYEFPEDFSSSEHDIPHVQEAAHSFLLRLCTIPDYGVLIMPQNNQWQVGTDLVQENSPVGGLGVATVTRNPQPVENKVLASFLQRLRVHENVFQCELSIAIFRAAPELLADYFMKKKSFTFEPKLTATWIGYSMFLLSIIQLPICESCFVGDDQRQFPSPPAVYMIMESILPRSLTKKIITRCINQNANLITFITLRILICAFRKFADFTEILGKRAQRYKGTSGDLWDQNSKELLLGFCKRCPDVKYVVTKFRRCSKSDQLMKEATTHLLALYYKILPQSTLDVKIDISIALPDALQDVSNLETTRSKGEYVQKLYSFNLLEIAKFSPDMKWWHKSGKTDLSPFTTLLRLHICGHSSFQGAKVKNILKSITEDTPIFKSDSKLSSFNLLCLSLRGFREWLASDSLFEFLDNCLTRLMKRPVKYYDDYVDLISTMKSNIIDVRHYEIDLLLITVMEQWSFLVTSASASAVENIVVWLARYLDFSLQMGSHIVILSHIRKSIQDLTTHAESCAILSRALDKISPYEARDELKSLTETNSEKTSTSPSVPASTEKFVQVRHSSEDGDHPVLRNWASTSISSAILDGTLAQLILCLCSSQQDIRIQAFIGLKKFICGLKTSDYTEWRQTYVLVGEIIEVVRDDISRTSLPYFAGAIAARSVAVLDDPLHFMYGKINKFLNKAPRWDLIKLPSYWVDQILLHPPIEGDSYYQETEWLLEALTDGLRTPKDMEIYRRCHILERLLCALASSSMPNTCNEKIINLLYHCSFVGGSSTLITRYGLLSWVNIMVKAGHPAVSDVQNLKRLAIQVYETSEKGRIDDWSGAAVMSLFNTLSKDHVVV